MDKYALIFLDEEDNIVPEKSITWELFNAWKEEREKCKDIFYWKEKYYNR